MLSRMDTSPQRIIARPSAVLTAAGDNTPMRINCGHANVVTCLIRYTEGFAGGSYTMTAETFDGIRWKRVTIENVGTLTVVAGTTITSGTATTFDQALKNNQPRATSEIEYVWTLSKRIYAIRFNFAEATEGVPGTLENVVVLSVD